MGESEPMTATAQIKAAQPKFQTVVPFGVRDALDINDIAEDEEVILEAEFKLQRVKKKDE